MKKKFGDLTLREVSAICKQHTDCKKCPLDDSEECKVGWMLTGATVNLDEEITMHKLTDTERTLVAGLYAVGIRYVEAGKHNLYLYQEEGEVGTGFFCGFLSCEIMPGIRIHETICIADELGIADDGDDDA